MQRGRMAAGLWAIVSLGIALGLVSIAGTSNAAVGPLQVPPALATPVTTAMGDRTLTVDSTVDLPVNNAPITLSGSGFDTDHGLYLAVCQAGLKKKDPLTSCIGGAIPGQNGTDSWAWISDDPDAEGAITWGEGGSFTVDLTLAAASGDSVDCLEVQCVLYARSDAEKQGDRPADLTIPVGFLQPTDTTTDGEDTSTGTSPSSTSTGPSTSKTSATKTSPTKHSPNETTESSDTGASTEATETTPVTIKVDGILSTQIQVGARQSVIFSGFLPEEEVRVTIFSEPKELDPMTASPEGVLVVSFEITEDLLPGTHIVQAIGLTSNASATADFTVLAAAVPSISASTIEPTSVGSQTVSTSEAITSGNTEVTESSDDLTTSASATLSVESSVVAPSTSQNTGATSASSNSSKAIWWLLAGLLVVLIVIVVISWIAIVRRQQSKREQDRLQREEELAEAAVLEQQRRGSADAPTDMIDPGPRSFQSPLFSGEHHGLISGHSGGDGPALYSGQGISDPVTVPGYQDEPTQFIPPAPEPTEFIPTDPPIEHEDNYGLFTHSTDHSGEDQIDPGPETEAWRADAEPLAAEDPESGEGTTSDGDWTEPPAR